MDRNDTNTSGMSAGNEQQPGQSGTPEQVQNADGPRDQQGVAQRAFGRFEARGFEHGYDVEDWLEAEQESSDSQRGTGDVE